MNDEIMVPQIGQQVKLLLKNNSIAEGYVVFWSNSWIKLRAKDNKSYLIIYHTHDLVMTKIFLEDEPENDMSLENQFKETKNPISLEEQFQGTYDGPSDDELRIKKLAELKILMAKQDKKIISEKIKSHHIGSAYVPAKIPYQTPNWMKVKSPYMPRKLPRK